MTALLLALISAPSVGVDGRWLTVDGRPTLLLGDSVTQGWMELGSDFDQLAYLDALAARGFNAVMLWSYIGITEPVADARIGYPAPALWPWERNGERFDLHRFNDAYFARLRGLIDAAGARGLVVILTIHDGWTKTRFAGHPFNAALGGPLTDRRQYVELGETAGELGERVDPTWDRRHRHQFATERFTARLVEATGDAPNLVYELFNEGEWYDQAELASFQRHAARFIRARCARPVMINVDHAREPLAEAADVISLHKPNWTRETTAREAFEHFAAVARAGKPVVFSEPVPEYRGDPADHNALCRLAWGTLLAGGGFLLQNDVSFGFAPRAAIATKLPAAEALWDRLAIAAAALRDIDLADLQPAGELADCGVCLAAPGREYLVYATGAVSVDLTAVAGRLRVERLDLMTGEWQAADELTGGGRRTIELPVGDHLLRLRAAE